MNPVLTRKAKDKGDLLVNFIFINLIVIKSRLSRHFRKVALKIFFHLIKEEDITKLYHFYSVPNCCVRFLVRFV